jgi:hypothetical protein
LPSNHRSADPTIVEVRAFAGLKQVFEERGWTFPYRYKLDGEVSALELARRLDLPIDKIESVFINGFTDDLASARVRAGDRVGYIPYGTPGAARLLLGIKRESEKSEEK